jgi:uncharacterized protein (TIGR04255 family)
MRIPRKITPCPIVDCVVELRFRTSVEAGAIFGIVYNEFKNDYPNVIKTAVLNIPEEIRLSDPNLLYQPWYQLRNGSFVLAIGPKQLALSKPGEYPGWSDFRSRSQSMAERLRGLGIADEIQRVGLRYINFFDFDIFDRIKLDVLINQQHITSKDTLVRVTIPGRHGHYESQMHVANRAIMTVAGTNKTGSVVDIDTYRETDLNNFFADPLPIIEEGHVEEKEVFFSLPKDDFLATLNPEY